MDFVGVLRELTKALQFDAADVSGAIEDIDLPPADLIDRIERAERDYPVAGEMDDEALEAVVYGGFSIRRRARFFWSHSRRSRHCGRSCPQTRGFATTFQRSGVLRSGTPR